MEIRFRAAKEGSLQVLKRPQVFESSILASSNQIFQGFCG